MELPLLVEISRDQLVSMSDLVKNAFRLSLKALFESEPFLARQVMENDKVINSYEIDIDNSTYNILASYQAPPKMLRTILAIQKINTALERIGDHAVNIAESALSLIHGSMEVELFDLPYMADLCKKILHDSLHGFFNNDQDLAKNVLSRDDVIDGLNIRMCNSIKEKIHSRTLSIEIAMELVRICKNLERIADLSTNIAEETCFAVEGKVLKHHAQ